MIQIKVVLLIVSCYVNSVLLNPAGSAIPDFIKPCKGTDLNLNQCAEKTANEVIPHFLKGYRPLNVPNLTPLEISEIKVEDKNFKLSITNASAFGFEDAIVKNVNIQLLKKHMGMVLSMKNFTIQGDYKMSGKVIVPLSGEGPCTISAYNGDFGVDIYYSLYDRDGVEYSKLEKVDVKIYIDGAHFDFENLLGNKKVSDDINAILNKEWKAVLDELGEAIKECVATIVIQIVNGIIHKVPHMELFGNEVPTP